MVNNSNISTDSNRTVYIEQQQKLIFKDKSADFVVFTAKNVDPTIKTLFFNDCSVKAFKNDVLIGSREQTNDEIQYFREEEAKKEIEIRNAVKASRQFTREWINNQMGE